MVPNKVFFTKGVGVHKERLASFEMALRAAGVAHCNLVLVSSIYPPGCKIISKEEGLKLLRPGEIVFAVYDRESNNEPNRLVAASVGLAIPSDSSMHGYLSEHHSVRCWQQRWALDDCLRGSSFYQRRQLVCRERKVSSGRGFGQ